MQELHFHLTPDTIKRHHSIRQEHHFPQGRRLVYRLLVLRPHRLSRGQLCQPRHSVRGYDQKEDHLLLVNQLHNRPRSHWMDHVVLPGDHGLVFVGGEA